MNMRVNRSGEATDEGLEARIQVLLGGLSSADCAALDTLAERDRTLGEQKLPPPKRDT